MLCPPCPLGVCCAPPEGDNSLTKKKKKKKEEEEEEQEEEREGRHSSMKRLPFSTHQRAPQPS